MYGLINEGIRELVVRLAGPDTWEEICREAGIAPEGFEPLCPYDDTLTFKLVDLASQKLKLPTDEVLIRYGHYWITYTAQSGYGNVMKLLGGDLRTCLLNLNRLHAHMGVSMPALRPPRFTVEALEKDRMVIHYHSHRTGLGPMVKGLLQALAEKHGNPITIIHSPKEGYSDHDTFLVEFASV